MLSNDEVWNWNSVENGLKLIWWLRAERERKQNWKWHITRQNTHGNWHFLVLEIIKIIVSRYQIKIYVKIFYHIQASSRQLSVFSIGKKWIKTLNTLHNLDQSSMGGWICSLRRRHEKLFFETFKMIFLGIESRYFLRAIRYFNRQYLNF